MQRLIRFGLVGVINTVIDFGLYNLLHLVLGLTLIEANLISTTVAMAFSFMANRKFVFRHDGHAGRQLVLFWLVTASGLYLIQTGIIHSISAVYGSGVVVSNLAKVAATAASMTWNYLMYREVVFR